MNATRLTSRINDAKRNLEGAIRELDGHGADRIECRHPDALTLINDLKISIECIPAVPGWVERLDR